MIDSKRLLSDLDRLLTSLEKDLRERATEPSIDEHLREEFRRAKAASRTGESFEVWRDELLTQVGVAWILGTVFVRFLEDNELVETPRLSGTGERLKLALDQQTLYFQKHPTETDREYLLDVFRSVKKLPAAADLFDEKHNPLWIVGLSGDGATELLRFWQRVNPDTGTTDHDFTDPSWSTRFLGDLYQDLSEAARKKYALLQTPEFVEEFILDRTLTPAIETFGYKEVKLIDPACGSGHFLLGAFQRLLELRLKNEPGVNPRELVQRTLDQVNGVDVNPFAVAIARFRLLLAALEAAAEKRLAQAPGFRIHVAAGDSLLHGPRPGDEGARQRYLFGDPLQHVYEVEDAEELKRILGERYQVVVGNPPYITVKDKALNAAYRERFGSCYRSYSLAVPFLERFFDLAIHPENGEGEQAGFIGVISANSFMKREFGKKLIEEFIRKWDLTHVIDTSGAYIPGHGTPTVILFGRHRNPVSQTVRAVMGIRGEPETPKDPSKGLVWSVIREQIDRPGSQSAFISVADWERGSLYTHPWSLGGGGAAELKGQLEEAAERRLADVVQVIGFGAVTREDDIYLVTRPVAVRHGIPNECIRPLVSGEEVRDWNIHMPTEAIWPYDPGTLETIAPITVLHFLWPWRAQLSSRVAYGASQIQRGLRWHEYSMFFRDRFRTPLSIAFAFVATHNHFVLDRGGKVFNRSAPVIKLPPEATEDDHLALLGLLNSSTACFWMKQVFYPKATAVGDISTEKGKPEANRYEFAGTGLADFPIPAEPNGMTTLRRIAGQLDSSAVTKTELEPRNIISKWATDQSHQCLHELLQDSEQHDQLVRKRMVALQEELDWETYKLYGLCDAGSSSFVLDDDSTGASPEERPFLWPSSEAPATLKSDLVPLYRTRRSVMESSGEIGMIETQVYKRPWLGQQGVFGHNTGTYRDRMSDALASWLADQLESDLCWQNSELSTPAKLADRVRSDSRFLEAAELYRGRPDFDLVELVTELVLSESVPFLPILRYKPSGLSKRVQWEKTWELQRLEDEGKHKDPIPVPPKYAPADFLNGTYWRVRGKLDVPKERFILFPHCERAADRSPVILWAGFNHLQQAQAIAAYYLDMKDREGWTAERLTPLLAGIAEVVPWVKQWHNDPDPVHGERMGDYFAQFLADEATALGLTIPAIRAWRPPSKKKPHAIPEVEPA
jgi:hypothetical protein